MDRHCESVILEFTCPTWNSAVVLALCKKHSNCYNAYGRAVPDGVNGHRAGQVTRPRPDQVIGHRSRAGSSGIGPSPAHLHSLTHTTNEHTSDLTACMHEHYSVSILRTRYCLIRSKPTLISGWRIFPTADLIGSPIMGTAPPQPRCSEKETLPSKRPGTQKTLLPRRLGTKKEGVDG